MGYLEQVTEKVKEYIYSNMANIVEICDDIEILSADLADMLLHNDSVTGHGSGSYYFSVEKSKKDVLGDFDTMLDAVSELCVDAETLGEKLLNDDWEYLDVTTRCYVLCEAIDEAIRQCRNDLEEAFNHKSVCDETKHKEINYIVVDLTHDEWAIYSSANKAKAMEMAENITPSGCEVIEVWEVEGPVDTFTTAHTIYRRNI